MKRTFAAQLIVSDQDHRSESSGQPTLRCPDPVSKTKVGPMEQNMATAATGARAGWMSLEEEGMSGQRRQRPGSLAHANRAGHFS